MTKRRSRSIKPADPPVFEPQHVRLADTGEALVPPVQIANAGANELVVQPAKRRAGVTVRRVGPLEAMARQNNLAGPLVMAGNRLAMDYEIMTRGCRTTNYEGVGGGGTGYGDTITDAQISASRRYAKARDHVQAVSDSAWPILAALLIDGQTVGQFAKNRNEARRVTSVRFSCALELLARHYRLL